MIAQSRIQSLAQKMQSTEQNVRREYVQNLFLFYFYQQPEAGKILFKGGTALRIIYQSPRFSEDLDFSGAVNTSNIEDILVQTAREIEYSGIKVDIKESKKTSGGYLAIIHFRLGDQEVAIQIEISQRKGALGGEAVTIVNDFIPPYTLVSLARDQLVAEKIQALLSRQKARDFYDLYFILRANLMPAKEKQVLKEVLAVLVKTRIDFERDLKVFLPKSHFGIIRDFKATLKREISP